MDPSMYSKKAVAAFQAAQKNVAPPVDSDGRPSIFLAFQEFKMPPNSGEQVNEKWGDGPVRWIMTSQEKSTWGSLAGGPEWQEFVDRFWESRNPQPGNPDNVFRTTFDRRVAFADAHFVQQEGTRGSMTDRGMVFVLLGPPTYVGRKPLNTGDDPTDNAGLSTVGSQDAANAQRAMTASGKPSSGSRAVAADQFSGPGKTTMETGANWREVWHYRKELLPRGVGYHQVDVEFITKKGYGTNVLQRDHATLATLDAAKASVRKSAAN
jgi:GWxTD domain-containing protein